MNVVPPAPELGAPLPQLPSPETLRFLALRRSTPAVMLQAPGPSRDEIATLLRLAMRVPDHGKLKPWRFIILEGESKDRYAARLESLAQDRGDAQAVAKLAKLKAPPLAIAVVSSPKDAPIPEWEQLLSAGAVCTNLLYAAGAMGYGSNWITDWYAYDAEAAAILGLAGQEKVAGFVLIGRAGEAPAERERPQPEDLVTRWTA